MQAHCLLPQRPCLKNRGLFLFLRYKLWYDLSMANKTIKYDSFKRGDTPLFEFIYYPPTDGFDWSGIVADVAITDIADPENNSGAGVYRPNVALSIDGDNNATLSFQPTVLESKALSPETEYKVEAQLKQGGDNVTTPVTGTVKVLQDYVI